MSATYKMKFPKYAVLLVYAASLEVWACLASELEDYYYLLQSFDDKIGAGNYTNFQLTRHGNIHICLQTLRGDADIYVSETNLKPNYEDYDLKSVTCGDDEVAIPATFKRPTAIAIYGHPRFDETRFRCSVYLDTRDLSQSDFDLPQQHGFESNVEEDHPGWMFLLKIIEFVLDAAL